MALTMYGFHTHPHDFAVTKADAPLEKCVWFLDFSRPLERLRRFAGFNNRWIGRTIGYSIPVIHASETEGGYLILVFEDEPYSVEIPQLWKQHAGSKRGLVGEPMGNMEIAADFARHFPENF